MIALCLASQHVKIFFHRHLVLIKFFYYTGNCFQCAAKTEYCIANLSANLNMENRPQLGSHRVCPLPRQTVTSRNARVL